MTWFELRIAALLIVGFVQFGFSQAWDDPNSSSLPDDFFIQGEYFGSFDDDVSDRLGAFVRSTGSGNFDIHFCEGGLTGPKNWPMGGWDQEWRGPLRQQKLNNGQINLSGSTLWSGTLQVEGSPKTANDSDKVIKGQKQGRAFTLYRVQRTPPSQMMPAPENANVLFDGTRESFDNNWNITGQGGYNDRTATIHRGVTSKYRHQACFLHIEMMGPYMPAYTGQARSNSGIYLQVRYEQQITDSFGTEGLEGDQKGGLYKEVPPLVNASLPPLQWETYDILFEPAQYSGGQKTANCSFTTWLNGVRVQDKGFLSQPGQGGSPEGPTPGPIFLQNHGGDNVYFRNIWLVEDPDFYPDTNLIVGKYASGVSMWQGCPDPGYLETNPDAMVVDKKYCLTKEIVFVEKQTPRSNVIPFFSSEFIGNRAGIYFNHSGMQYDVLGRGRSFSHRDIRLP